MIAMEESLFTFHELAAAAKLEDIPIDPRYLNPNHQLSFDNFHWEYLVRSKQLLKSYVLDRIFLQLPSEYAEFLPEFQEYFQLPHILAKLIYGLNIAAKAWNEDLTERLLTNVEITFV